jgi:TniQ
MKSRYTEYEDWEQGVVDLPARSRLYSLAPVGIGTAQAECLTSYLMRLAEAHCLAPGTLYKHLIYPLVRAEAAHPDRQLRPGSQAVLGAIRAAHCWNGADRSASNLVRVLERLTCVQELHLLTWLPWAAILSRYLNLRRQRAWCPNCLSEWRGNGQVIYEPLLWTLPVVRICPIHDRTLAEVCPSCRQTLKTLSSNVRPGHCSRCRRWLGDNGEDQPSSECLQESGQLREQRWIVESIGELVARAPGLSNSLSLKSINENVEAVISRLIKGNGPAVPDLIEVRKKIVSFWRGGRSIPRLGFILKLCYRLDLSMADFMTAMINRLSCGILVDETQPQNPKAPTKREAVAAWETNVRQTLEAALLEEPPPPLLEIAGRLGYASTWPLNRKYGDLSRGIAARYRKTIRENDSINLSLDEKQPSLLRQLLEQELSKENPCHPRWLAKKAGYRYVDPATRQFPELWWALLDKHRKYREEEKSKQHERERGMLVAALSEDPTPTISEIIRRLGARSHRTLIDRFPEECRAISEKHNRQTKDRLEELEAKLRAALSEHPRPLTQVAASLPYNRNDCYRRWPELCRAIVARHTDYKSERARERKFALEEQVRQIALELYRRGLHPTKERVIPLLHNPQKTCFVTLNRILREIREELNLPTL